MFSNPDRLYRNLLRDRLIVTLTDNQGTYSGVLYDLTATCFEFWDVQVPNPDDHAAEWLSAPGRVLQARNKVLYLQTTGGA